MDWLDAVVLGLVQGLTEFLPVSSSGHLALTHHFLRIQSDGLAFEVWLHVATLVAVVAALQKEIRNLLRGLLPSAQPQQASAAKNMVVCLVVGTLPAVVVGLTAKSVIENAFQSPKAVGVGLLFTAGILVVSKLVPVKGLPLNVPRALAVGIGQALAIFPGVSRSGTTLTTGLVVGMAPLEAARFGFLLAVPAILGATVLELDALMDLGRSQPLPLLLGFAAAAGSGYLAVRLVWKLMEQGRLWIFAPYCAVVGLISILFL